MKKEFKPYPKYRDSGLSSFADIPNHWQVKPLGTVFSFTKGLSITKDNLQDEGVPCVNYGEIHSRYGFRVNPAINALKCVDPRYLSTHPQALLGTGDFAFADTSEDIEGSGNFTHLEGSLPVFAGYHTVIARPEKNIHPLFLAYELSSTPFRSQIQQQVKGIKVFSITQGLLKSLRCWLPPAEEQMAIARFLDEETAKIDAAIKELEESIELLLETRRNSILDILCGGSNTSKPLKYIGNFKGGAGFPIEEQADVDGDISFLKVKHLSQSNEDGLLSSDEYRISRNTAIRLRATVFPVGTIVFAKVGAALLLNRFAMLTKPACIDNNMMGFEVTHSDADKQYVFRAMDSLIRFEDIVNPGAVPSINTDQVSSQCIPWPGKTSQTRIADQIRANCLMANSLISEKQSLIESLKEYRTSLVYEAVTGKIDLRAA